MIWIGANLLNKTAVEQKSLGFALFFSTMPFARILNPILRCEDEANLVQMLIPDLNNSSNLTLLLILLITGYPLYLAYKTIGNKNKIGWFILFFLAPVVLDLLMVLGVMNTLLAKEIVSNYGILGSPIMVNMWSLSVLLVFVLTRKNIYTLFNSK